MQNLNQHYPFVNMPLPYAYSALEPFIDTQTMHLHHDKHLQTYIDNLNSVLKDNPHLQNYSLEELIFMADELEEPLETQIERNAGGVFNHFFFFNSLKPNNTAQNEANPNPSSSETKLLSLIEKQFNSLEEFKSQLKTAALSVFGSGYAWLVINKKSELKITTTKNQETPITKRLYPLLNIDVWEHAYYLKYHNLRSDYLDALLNLINYPIIASRLDNLISFN